MSFRSDLFSYISANIAPLLPYPIRYGFGSADDDGAFYNVLVVSDPQQAFTLCENQGESGVALVQFGFTGGNTSESASLGWAEDELEKLNVLVSPLLGSIGSYAIFENVTSGVQSVGNPDAQWWGVLFESSLSWTQIM